jgi:hypothetical protein
MKMFNLLTIRNTECNLKRAIATKGKTYEEIYGAEKARSLKIKRVKDTKRQMKQLDQRSVRSMKTKHWWDTATAEEIKSASAASSIAAKRTMPERIKTNLKRYGIRHGCLKNGRQSKSALKFIKNFIDKNNIPPEECHFHGNIHPEYRLIGSKQTYCFYDFVWIVGNKIKVVLEFNGPYHPTKEEYELKPLERKFFKSGKTIKEMYEKDQEKIQIMKDLGAETIIIYWQSKKTFDIYGKVDNIIL